MPEVNDLTQMFQALIELTDAIHWEMDIASGKFTYVSPQIKDILGYPPETWETFDAWAETIHPDDREYAVNFCLEKTRNSEDHAFVYRVLNVTGETVWLRDVVKVISKDGSPVRLFGIMFDITSQKRAEAALKESERRYRTIISSSPVGIVVCNAEGQAISTNRAMADIVGATEEQILKQNYHYIESWKKSGIYDAAVSAVETGQTERIDTELVTSFGKKISLRAYFTPLGSGELLAMMQDITELLSTQKELSRALEDKNLLMNEMQHRTKNNLFILQSLLSLQARGISDKKSREYIADARNRVTSMALIHEMLNRPDVVTRMNSAIYIRKLVNSLCANYCLGSQNISLQYDIEDVTLDADTLIPLGLIINELVTNVFKYAFPDGRDGTLSVSLKTPDTDTANYELVIKDNGVGLPEDFNLESTTSLGLEIVKMLVGQIKGTLHVSGTEGAEFRLRFAEKLVE
jgi:PAS domain S-box-containing protein